MKKLFLITAAIALLCMGCIAQASPITGTTGWGLFGNLTTDAGNQTITFPQPPGFSGIFFQVAPSGDFAALVPLTFVSSTPLDLNNLTTFTIGAGSTVGTWATTGGSHDPWVSDGSINVQMTGTFTPGTMLPGKTVNSGTMSIGIIMTNGVATNASGSMLMDPVVPEPSSLALLASGVMGLGVFMRRRR